MRRVWCLLAVVGLSAVAAAQQTLTIELKDFATMPMTGVTQGKASNEVLLARVNAMREEPGGATRLFVTDMNGPLYILDKKTKKFTTYLDFDGREGQPGLFHRFFIDDRLRQRPERLLLRSRLPAQRQVLHRPHGGPAADGVEPAGHQELPGAEPRRLHDDGRLRRPARPVNEGVLIEWTDTNPSNATFEGTARELMRVRLNTRSHPDGRPDLQPDGASGRPGLARDVRRSRRRRVRRVPHRGDPSQPAAPRQPRRQDSSHHSRFERARRRRARSARTGATGFRTTIRSSPRLARDRKSGRMGLRNPHRLSWAVDPENAANNRLIANSVGFHTWETVNIIAREQSRLAAARRPRGAQRRTRSSGRCLPSTRFRCRSASEVTDTV